MERDRQLKVNLGSGSRGLPDWINVDAGLKYKLWPFLPLIAGCVRFGLVNARTVNWLRDTGKPPPDLKAWNLTRRLPFDDESVDCVYSAETIEHFEYYVGQRIIKEIYRILKPDGLVRIATPDGLKIAHAYAAGIIDNTRFNAFFYEPLETYFEPSLFERFGRKVYTTKYHLWIYDFGSLADALRSAGFRNVVESAIGAGELPDVGRLESFDQGELSRDRGFSLYVESRK